MALDDDGRVEPWARAALDDLRRARIEDFADFLLMEYEQQGVTRRTGGQEERDASE